MDRKVFDCKWVFSNLILYYPHDKVDFRTMLDKGVHAYFICLDKAMRPPGMPAPMRV